MLTSLFLKRTVGIKKAPDDIENKLKPTRLENRSAKQAQIIEGLMFTTDNYQWLNKQ